MNTVTHTGSRGFNLCGVPVGNGERINLFTTKKQAVKFAQERGWTANDVSKAYTRFFRGYIVAQCVGVDKIRILTDTSWRDFPYDAPSGFSVQKQ